MQFIGMPEIRVGSESVEKQVGFPALIQRSDKVPDERHMVGAHRFPAQRHHCFVRRTVAFLIITSDARTHQIFPGVLAPA